MNSVVSLFFKGMAMGTVDIVPGVSGSTVAVLLGIYERFIGALRNINLELLRALLAPFTGRFSQSSRAVFMAGARKADLPWLLTLLAGLFAAFIVASMVIPLLMERFPQIMRGVFFGLVLGSMITPVRDIKKWRPVYLVPLALCAVFFFFILGHQFAPPARVVELVSRGDTLEALCREAACFVPPGEILSMPQNEAILSFGTSTPIAEGVGVFVTQPYYLYCLLAGFCAICAMLLPGVSGSFILLVLGCYYFMLNTGKSFIHGLSGGFFYGAHLLYLGCFVLGALVGIAIFSRVFSWIISHHREMTLAGIVGILLGCLRAIWPFRNAQESGIPVNVLPAPDTPLLIPTLVAVAGGLGIVIVTLVAQSRAERKRNPDGMRKEDGQEQGA